METEAEAVTEQTEPKLSPVAELAGRRAAELRAYAGPLGRLDHDLDRIASEHAPEAGLADRIAAVHAARDALAAELVTMAELVESV